MTSWTENENGNFVHVIDTDEVMTVFKKTGSGEWSGVYDGKFLKGSYDSPEEAQKALERFVFNGEAKLAKAFPTGWQASKKGGYYKRSANGIVTVKQATSGKWYICSDKGLVSKNKWFDTAEEAKQKANAFA
jgi:hypothetical protein